MSNKESSARSYFSTGEFAKLFDISKQTLFYYDKEGVFSPEVKKDNGYRYYSSEQYDVFFVIRMLQRLDVPLKTIKDYMNQRSPSALKDILESQTEHIDQIIADCIQAKHYIIEKNKILDIALSAIPRRSFTEQCGESAIYVTRHNGTSSPRDIALSVTNNINYCSEKGVCSAHTIGGMIPADSLPKDVDYNYSHFYTLLSEYDYNSIEDLSFKKELSKKPAGKYASIFHNGGFSDIFKSYRLLSQYIKRNKLNTGDFFYEDILLDDSAVKGWDGYLMKISIQIL